jgi:hypothetical protein
VYSVGIDPGITQHGHGDTIRFGHHGKQNVTRSNVIVL